MSFVCGHWKCSRMNVLAILMTCIVHVFRHGTIQRDLFHLENQLVNLRCLILV
jgi:hypothetical protein